MRYTEVRLAKIAQEMLADIDRDTVDFVPNYDETQQEPVVLPARLPNLLVNGSSGIAVGMATNIPAAQPERDRRRPGARAREPGGADRGAAPGREGPGLPDRAATSTAPAGIRDAFTTGRGIITMRAQAHTEKLRGGREAIVVTELPYQVNKATLMRRSPSSRARGSSTASPRSATSRTAHGHPDGAGAGEGRDRADRPQPALQAHRDAVDVRRQHAGPRRPAAAGGHAPGDARPLHRLPAGGRDPAHALRPGARRGARPHPGGPPEGARPPRPGDPPDPGRRERRRRARRR